MSVLSRSQLNRTNLAYNEAFKSPCNRRHGCVITSAGKVIGSGYNVYRTTSSDTLVKNCTSCHAEISAIRSAVKRNKLGLPCNKGSPQCKLSE